MAAKVAFIGTGGTMSSVGRGPLDLLDYSINKTMLHAEKILAAFPEVHEVAQIVPVRFKALPSTALAVTRDPTEIRRIVETY